jgi:hypothetical protein
LDSVEDKVLFIDIKPALKIVRQAEARPISQVARRCYLKASCQSPETEQLHHILAILPQPNAPQQLLAYCKALSDVGRQGTLCKQFGRLSLRLEYPRCDADLRKGSSPKQQSQTHLGCKG